MATTVTLEDEVDVSRGDMIVGLDSQPVVTSDIEEVSCGWQKHRSWSDVGMR